MTRGINFQEYCNEYDVCKLNIKMIKIYHLALFIKTWYIYIYTFDLLMNPALFTAYIYFAVVQMSLVRLYQTDMGILHTNQ